jgi:hypothetical protein
VALFGFVCVERGGGRLGTLHPGRKPPVKISILFIIAERPIKINDIPKIFFYLVCLGKGLITSLKSITPLTSAN